MKNKEKIKMAMAVVSFFASIVAGFTAMFIPPHGIIDASVLWFTAQLLVFTSTLLGLSMSIDHLRQTATNQQTTEETNITNLN